MSSCYQIMSVFVSHVRISSRQRYVGNSILFIDFIPIFYILVVFRVHVYIQKLLHAISDPNYSRSVDNDTVFRKGNEAKRADDIDMQVKVNDGKSYFWIDSSEIGFAVKQPAL